MHSNLLPEVRLVASIDQYSGLFGPPADAAEVMQVCEEIAGYRLGRLGFHQDFPVARFDHKIHLVAAGVTPEVDPRLFAAVGEVLAGSVSGSGSHRAKHFEYNCMDINRG